MINLLFENLYFCCTINLLCVIFFVKICTYAKEAFKSGEIKEFPYNVSLGLALVETTFAVILTTGFTWFAYLRGV